MIRNIVLALSPVFLLGLVLVPLWGFSSCNNHWISLYISILANFLFLLVGILLPWIIWHFFSHGKITSFFKPLTGNRIVIAISLPEMAKDKGLEIPMVSFEEMKRAYELAEIFTYRIHQYDDSHQGILERTIVSPFCFEVIHALEEGKQIPDSNFNISLGSPLYNSYSKWVEETLSPIIKTKASEAEISFSYSGSPEYKDLNHAFIQRIVKDDRVFFYLGGNSDLATTGAVLYFKKKWATWIGLQDKSLAVILMVNLNNPNISSELVLRVTN